MLMVGNILLAVELGSMLSAVMEVIILSELWRFPLDGHPVVIFPGLVIPMFALHTDSANSSNGLIPS